MKILFDARPLARPNSGIGRYLGSLLPEMSAQNPDWEFVGIIDGKAGDFDQLANVRFIKVSSGALTAALFPFFSSLITRRVKPDWYWATRHHLPLVCPRATKKIVTVHDVVWKEYPKTMPRANWLIERLNFPRSMRLADRIITTTEVGKAKVVNYFKVDAQKVHALTFPIKGSLGTQPTKKISENYLLCVGTFEPRKNFDFVVKHSREIVAAAGVDKIIIAGSEGWGGVDLYGKIKDFGVEDIVSIVESPSDKELANLYASAKLHLVPSLAEGFGLSISEALSYATPVVANEIPEVKEVYGNVIKYFVSNRIDSLLSVLRESPLDSAKMAELSGKTWACAATKMLGFLKEGSY